MNNLFFLSEILFLFVTRTTTQTQRGQNLKARASRIRYKSNTEEQFRTLGSLSKMY